MIPVPYDPRGPRQEGAFVVLPPWELFVLEQTWDLWLGSATEIARVAARADHWMQTRFGSVQLQPVSTICTVGTTSWAGGASVATLADEINARRSLFESTWIDSYVTRLGWPHPIFDQGRERPVPPEYPIPMTETVGPPQRVEMKFETNGPAARLRITAPSPTLCTSLFNDMQPHVDAGARPNVWTPETAASVGVVIGAAVPDALLLPGWVTSWVVLALMFALGALGWFAGLRVIRWAFPPLELVEAWERTRWQRLVAGTWQFVLMAFAVAGVIVAVLLAK
jgi:hypothetical protein